MNPVTSVSSVLRNFLNFRGRASRSEYWWFFLVAAVVGLVSVIWISPFWHGYYGFIDILGFLYALFSLAVLLPVIHLVVMPAVTVRRLHDADRSARWLLVTVGIVMGWGLIVGFVAAVAVYSDDALGPLILALFLGFIWILVSFVGLLLLTIALAQRGTTGPNRYGPDPLRPELGEDLRPAPAHAYPPPAADTSVATGRNLGQPQPQPEPEPVDRQFCTQCGGQLQSDARFCTTCGNSV